jgi:hypothetical protein
MHKSFFYRHLCFRRQSKTLIHCVLIGLITMFLNLLPATPVWAQIGGDGICEDVDVSPNNPENDTDGDGIYEDVDAQTKRSVVDATHNVISRRIELSADWLDKFFDDERYVSEQNQTRLKVKLSSFIEDGEGLENSTKLGLRVSLPRLEKKLKKLSKKLKKVYLVFSADADDENDIDNTLQDDLDIDVHDADDENANAGLMFIFKDSIDRNVRIKAGVKTGGGTQFYVGPRYRQSIRFEKWTLRLTERIRYYTDDGFESKARIDFDRPMTKRLFFRASTDSSWYEEKTGFYYNFRLFLFHVISPIRVLEYELRASYKTKPHHQLRAVVFKVRYRQPFLKKWIFLDLVPMATFPRKKDFDFTPGFMVQLEFIFGKIGKRLGRRFNTKGEKEE